VKEKKTDARNGVGLSLCHVFFSSPVPCRPFGETTASVLASSVVFPGKDHQMVRKWCLKFSFL
jgi:hypothetical protein